MSRKYTIGDQLTVKIEKIVPRGLGLAFADGLTVFVALAAAGDTLRVVLTEIKGKTGFAEIEEIVEPSGDRVDPPCEYFGNCGGCDFQHLNYSAQLRTKVAMIRDCISRIGKIDHQDEIVIIPSPAEFEYRLRAQWHVDPRGRRIGYFRRNSRDLIDIERCRVLVPELQAQLERFRISMRWSSFSGEKAQIDAACGSSSEISVFSPELLEPTNEITFRTEHERYNFSARSFFQGNRYLIDTLVEIAIGDSKGEIALDLYSGVGLFSLPLARRFNSVIGVEDNEAAVEMANRNAEAANAANLDFYAASVRDYLASGEAPKPDFVLLDPPRAGTEKETIQNLIDLDPERVSYVACEPSILARDLRRFVDRGYRIAKITAIDLFPQTHHVETVAHLSRT